MYCGLIIKGLKKSTMKIYDSKNIIDLKEIPVLNDSQIYIYAMLNNHGFIKIGQTTNIVQRLQSLSGSNSGGNKIIKLALSDPTYLTSAERAFHNKYNIYRIDGTEWFKGLVFEDVVQEMEKQFSTEGYKVSNALRKEIIEKEQEKLRFKEEEKLKEKPLKKKERKSK